MKTYHLMALSAAMAALLIFAAAEAEAQQSSVGGSYRNTFPSHRNHFSWERKHGIRGGLFVVEREVPVIVEPLGQAQDIRIQKEPAEPPVAVTPPPPSRKPYVIGSSYASLPGGCMKLIDEGVSYYYCSGGEWYRQTGKLYRAVAKP